MLSLRKESKRNGGEGRIFLGAIVFIPFVILCLDAAPSHGFPAAKAKSRLPEILISVESAAQARGKNNEMLFIDIRPASEFEKLRIPGSLNLPLFVVKTKTFLKQNTLVLVDEGYRYGSIEEECNLLKKAGFRIRILNGGLYAWSQRGAPLEGDDFARKSLNRLSPMHFFPEKDYGDWIILNVSESRQTEARALFPGSVFLLYANDDAGFVSRYEDYLKRAVNGPLVRVLVVDERGNDYDRLEKIIGTTAYKDAFFLEGGLDAYRRYVDSRNSTGIKHPVDGRCESCGRGP